MSNKTIGYTESNGYRCLEDLEQTNDFKTMTPINLLYCGKEDCTPGWCFGPYVRENYVIHTVTSGTGVYKVNGKVYQLKPGQAFLIYPGAETIYQADPETPWSYMWLGFNGIRGRSVVEEIGFSEGNPVVTLDDTDRISNAIDRILDAGEMTLLNDLKRMEAFYDALTAMIELNTQEKPRNNYTDDRYVNTAIDIIIANYSERVRVADIADKVGINRSYLTSIFKKEMNMSPQEFLINYRLEKAAQMLKATQDPIGSIATAVGYTDPLAFSKAFRKKFNSTPSEYRAEKPVLTRIDFRGGYEGSYKL